MDESGNPASVSHSKTEEEPSKVLSGVMVVGERADDAGEVSGPWKIVAKPRKPRVVQSGDAPCPKGVLLQYNTFAILLSYFNW